MGRGIEDSNKLIANRFANWHLDAWEEFTRLDEREQKIWEHIKTKGKLVPFEEEPERKKVHTKKVLEVYTGDIYPSILIASKVLKITRRSIYYSLNKNKKILDKYKFVYVEE